ncbi:MAG: hypothetical protein ABIH49_02275 [archaeon]
MDFKKSFRLGLAGILSPLLINPILSLSSEEANQCQTFYSNIGGMSTQYVRCPESQRYETLSEVEGIGKYTVEHIDANKNGTVDVIIVRIKDKNIIMLRSEYEEYFWQADAALRYLDRTNPPRDNNINST